MGVNQEEKFLQIAFHEQMLKFCYEAKTFQINWKVVQWTAERDEHFVLMIHWINLSSELAFCRLNCLYTLNYNRRAFFPEEAETGESSERERERQALNRLAMNEYENGYLWL